MILELWTPGFSCGSELQLERSKGLWQANIFFTYPTSDVPKLPAHAVGLVRLLTTYGGKRERWSGKSSTQKTLLRETAMVIDRAYGLRCYHKLVPQKEIGAASALIKFAMTVEVLHRITHSSLGGVEMASYAMNLDHLRENNDILWGLIMNASGRGVGTVCLVQAASSLWTGATSETALPLGLCCDMSVRQIDDRRLYFPSKSTFNSSPTIS